MHVHAVTHTYTQVSLHIWTQICRYTNTYIQTQLHSHTRTHTTHAIQNMKHFMNTILSFIHTLLTHIGMVSMVTIQASLYDSYPLTHILSEEQIIEDSDSEFQYEEVPIDDDFIPPGMYQNESLTIYIYIYIYIYHFIIIFHL